MTVRGQRIALAGVDDPYTRRDRYDLIAGPADRDAVVRIGVAHAPEPRMLDRFAADGYDLVLAGHTHGGQVRLPGFGALVTNCGIDRSRARGLSRWGSHTVLNVSAGLGTSPYMPMRFCCRPGGHADHPAPPGRCRRRSVGRHRRRRPVLEQAGTEQPASRRGPDGPGHLSHRLDSSRPRGVAQLGSALRSGRRGRRFKSCHPDQWAGARSDRHGSCPCPGPAHSDL